ncbi:hypothetical protein [Candidatus Clostridium helianthi]|uniref:ABC transporter permease n=1 Tax=Candidatus Clostridium helianthi TaxID=3381660 RepID=A0ABW8RY10_9CLOT
MKTNLLKTVEVLLVFSIVFAIVSIFLKYVILNESTYLSIFDKSGVYAEVKDSIYKKIDNLLSSKNINFDIKKSIITDEDIKRETNNAVYGVLEYLKTGENNITPPDTSIYKQRVSDMLDTVINGMLKPSNGDLSFNSNFYVKNMAYTKSSLKGNEMNYLKKTTRDGQDTLEVEKLMSKSEAEAKVREILKEKGLTEEEAIEKATKKGITEEQALKILAGYGITIDDYGSGENNSEATTNADSNGNSKVNAQDSNGGSSKDATSSKNENQDSISAKQDNKGVKTQLDNIKNKLLDEASKSIDQEVEKMNFNKVLESSKFQKLAKVTSIIYRLFWLFIMIPIFIMAILIKINAKGLNSSLKYIGMAFLFAGLILVAVASSVYFLKIYENINISPVYIKDTVYTIVRHSLMVLAEYGAVALVMGLLMLIPTKKYLIK